jgi:hypothetical protein
MSERLVWFEVREKRRFRWQWWGWKKVDAKPVPEDQVSFFIQIAMAPYVLQGVEYRLRSA